MMKKITLSSIVIVLLLLLNSLTLAFMWTHHAPPPPPFGPPGGPPRMHGGPHGGGPGAYIAKELGFDEKQKEAFDKLKTAHRERARAIQDTLRILKGQLFAGIPSGDMTKANADADKIAAMQKQLEIMTYEHFKQVRDLCTEEQKAKFDKIIGNILELLAPPGGPPMGMGGPPS